MSLILYFYSLIIIDIILNSEFHILIKLSLGYPETCQGIFQTFSVFFVFFEKKLSKYQEIAPKILEAFHQIYLRLFENLSVTLRDNFEADHFASEQLHENINLNVKIKFCSKHLVSLESLDIQEFV